MTGIRQRFNCFVILKNRCRIKKKIRMNNFTFHIPTDIRFGKDQIQCLPEELAKYGKKVLLVYGGGSIKRSGLYDKIRELLKDFENCPG